MVPPLAEAGREEALDGGESRAMECRLFPLIVVKGCCEWRVIECRVPPPIIAGCWGMLAIELRLL